MPSVVDYFSVSSQIELLSHLPNPQTQSRDMSSTSTPSPQEDQENLRKELINLIDKYTSLYKGCQYMTPDEIVISHDDGYGGVHKITKKVYANPPESMTDESMANDIIRLMNIGTPGLVGTIGGRIGSLLFDDRLVKYFLERRLLGPYIDLDGVVCNYKSFMEILKLIDCNVWPSMFRAISRRPPTFDRQETKAMLLKMVDIRANMTEGSVSAMKGFNRVTGKVILAMMTEERYVDNDLIRKLIDGCGVINWYDYAKWPRDLLWNVDNCEIIINHTVNTSNIFEMPAKIIIHARMGGNKEVIKRVDEYISRLISSTDGTVSWITGIGMSINRMSPKYGIELTSKVLDECVNEYNFLRMVTDAAGIHPCKQCGLADNVPGILDNRPRDHYPTGRVLSEARRCMRVHDMLLKAGFTSNVHDMNRTITDGDIDVVLKHIDSADIGKFGIDASRMEGLALRKCSSTERISIVDALVRGGWKVDAIKILRLLKHGDVEFCSHVIRNYGDVNMKIDRNNFLTKDTWSLSGEIISLLLDLGIDIDHVSPAGRNALYDGNHIGRLCEAGVNPNLWDHDGITPLKHLTRAHTFGAISDRTIQKLKTSMCDNLVLSFAAMVLDSQACYGMEMMYGEFLDMINPV